MRVLSIDPGYDRCGIAVLEKNKVLFSDCLTTDKADSASVRLHSIGKQVLAVIHEHRPTACALEKLFFGNNQKTASAVAETRGMLLYLAHDAKLRVFEYTPQEIKVAVTGYGKSDKNSVISMVQKLIPITKDIRFDDEFDAIAVGLTCLACEDH